MDVPSNTIDLIRILQKKYPDIAEEDEKIVGTPRYWKKIGVIELVRELMYSIERKVIV